MLDKNQISRDLLQSIHILPILYMGILPCGFFSSFEAFFSIRKKPFFRTETSFSKWKNSLFRTSSNDFEISQHEKSCYIAALNAAKSFPTNIALEKSVVCEKNGNFTKKRKTKGGKSEKSWESIRYLIRHSKTGISRQSSTIPMLQLCWKDFDLKIKFFFFESMFIYKSMKSMFIYKNVFTNAQKINLMYQKNLKYGQIYISVHVYTSEYICTYIPIGDIKLQEMEIYMEKTGSRESI